jgi:hypothetical protein
VTRPEPWLRRGVYSLAAGLIVSSALALALDGRLPARVPDDAPPLVMADLLEALTAVDSQGQVDLAQLKAHHAALERYVAALAKTAPSTAPERFPATDEKLAFWLNAEHALVLSQLLEVRGSKAGDLSWPLRAWPIGGARLTTFAIARRFLEASGDARVMLALFTGVKGRGVLDGAPFDGATLDPQLDDAARRFLRSPRNVRLEGDTVHVSALLHELEPQLLAALPEGRHSVLQVVWAYLPDACEGRPGCLTRGDLDRACGSTFETCPIAWERVDDELAVTH